MKKIFIFTCILHAGIIYADNSEPPQLPQIVQPNPPIQAIPQINNKDNNSSAQKKPILVLTNDDKKALTELNKFSDDLEPKIKNQIQEFEDKMKILRAQSQNAYEKLSHEAKLALKGKKDKIDLLSEAAKKTYYKHE